MTWFDAYAIAVGVLMYAIVGYGMWRIAKNNT
jgi:hypothetical protein